MRALLAFLACLLISSPALAQGITPAGSGSSTPSGAAGGDLGGTYPNPTVLSVADVTTGVLGAPNGGFGVASPTAHCVLVGEGASAVTPVCPSTAGQALASNGATADPSFQPVSGGGGCAVSGTVNQIVSNTGSATCQASAATANTAGALGNVASLTTTGGAAVASGFAAAATGTIGWNGRGSTSSSAAGDFQFGVADAAAPVAQTVSVQSVVAGTSNTAGVSLTIQGSRSTGTGAGGSIILATGTTGTTGTAQNAAQTVETLDTNQHVKFSSAAIPTIGAGTVTANSTDVAGSLTTGTTVTSVVLSFKIAYATAPFCVVIDNTATVALTAYSVSTTAITMTMTANTGHVVSWVCHGG